MDLYASYNDLELAEAFLAVMRRCGVEVLIPPQRGCGMPAMDYGSARIARRVVRDNIRRLHGWAARGYPIVCTEPTAALTLRQEMAFFSDDPRLRTIERQVREALDFCAELRAAGRLPDSAWRREVPLTFGYHQPCHHRALKIGLPGVELVRALPGARVEVIERGCCGIAGTWGMKKKNFDRSMEIGRGLFEALREERVDVGMSECSTCKMQMDQGSGKETIHPVKALAYALGEPVASVERAVERSKAARA